MVTSLGVLPLHLACQFLVTQNCTDFSFSLATDTLLSKTVIEQLPDGYAAFKGLGVAYKNYKKQLKWDQARKVCAGEGGYLAVMDSLEKIESINSIREPGSYPWVGIHRLFDVTEWTSIKNGLPTEALPWKFKVWESDRARRCTALWADGTGVYPIFCHELHPFVCEIPIFT